MNRQLKAALAAVLMAGTMATTATPADAHHQRRCEVPGNRAAATWGCGKASWNRRDKSLVTFTIQDTKTNRSCIQVQIQDNRGGWRNTGLRECNERPLVLQIDHDRTVLDARIVNERTGRWSSIS